MEWITQKEGNLSNLINNNSMNTNQNYNLEIRKVNYMHLHRTYYSNN
jgi:hypothetical protein